MRVKELNDRLGRSRIDDGDAIAIVNRPDVIVPERRDRLDAYVSHGHAVSHCQARIICAANPPTNASVRSQGSPSV